MLVRVGGARILSFENARCTDEQVAARGLRKAEFGSTSFPRSRPEPRAVALKIAADRLNPAAGGNSHGYHREI